MSHSSTLDVLCPGLLGPLPVLPQPLPATPTLDRLLARAERFTTPASADPHAALLGAFGLIETPERDLPTASLCLFADSPDAAVDGYWMHADPVHLRPDRDQLRLFASASIAPDRAEADALVELFNTHFAADGLLLLAPTPTRWYLRCAQALDLRTQPLARVQGRAIGADLPVGADARQWIRLLNEAQMLFFDSAVNRDRERHRRPSINGLWTWGGGHLPNIVGTRLEVLVGDHLLTRGLAQRAGVAHQSLADWEADTLERGQSVMVYWDALWTALQEQDLAGWAAALARLDATLVSSESRLRRGTLRWLGLDPCHGPRLRVTRAGLYRIWRQRGLRHAVRVQT